MPRNPALDGVRGLAILFVIGYHGFAWSMGSDGWTGLARAVSSLTRFGWLGVDLFFVLSGYLITGVLLDARGDRHYFRNFYARRALRILPLYYLCVAVVVLALPRSGAFGLLCLAYVPNLAVLFAVPMAYGALWSLAVEEHFYLVWPWLVRAGGRRWLLGAALTLCAVEPLARAVGFSRGSDTHMYTWFRLDGLAWGAVVALVRQPARAKLAFAGGGLTLLAVGLPFGILSRTNIVGAALQYVPWTLLFAALVLCAADGSPRVLARVLRLAPLRRMGDYSYFMYLFHTLLFIAWDRLFPVHSLGGYLLRFVAVCAVLIVAAALSYRFVEQPILRLKSRFSR